jgi:hypothetical protein
LLNGLPLEDWSSNIRTIIRASAEPMGFLSMPEKSVDVPNYANLMLASKDYFPVKHSIR